MKFRSLQYIKLRSSDEDIPFLKKIHSLPEISHFISIDVSNYFNYVTTTDNVFYYKVIYDDQIVASIHMECAKTVLYISILTLPRYQNQGFATQIIEDIKVGNIIKNFNKIVVSIDRDNTASIRLFEKAGFILVDQEDELLNYSWIFP